MPSSNINDDSYTNRDTFFYEHLPDNEDALGEFPGSLPQSVSFMVTIERSMLEDKEGQVKVVSRT